ncbi:MAG TPA: hypothetical protein VFD92_25050 [Candidatus Binatia bacterium]|nr:hypothetical protein [Candidatus Binatia bacterium]
MRDRLRGGVRSAGAAPGRKEWFHFCVGDGEAELLANFSLCEDVRPGADRRPDIGRLTVLARRDSYVGDVETFPADHIAVRSAGIDLTFGANRLAYADGAYRLSLDLSECALSACVDLRPVVVPTLAPNIPLPDGPPLQWAIVPRLEATGWMSLDGREHRFERALAYHDHNWGHFLWGHRFSWIWGFCLPRASASPWSIVFVRLANRLRTSALAQGLFVWKGERAHRIFREDDLALEVDSAFLRPRSVLKVPAVMSIPSPETATEVPRSVEMRARADGDHLVVRFELEDVAQVLIPSETDLGVTIINEVSGRALVEGELRGEALRFEGRGMCEFLGS